MQSHAPHPPASTAEPKSPPTPAAPNPEPSSPVTTKRSPFGRLFAAIALVTVGGLLGLAAARMWIPAGEAITPDQMASVDEHDHEHGDEHSHDEADDPHVHEGHTHEHSDNTAIKLSQQARANLALALGRVELGTFRRTITVPAMVAGRPGRTEMKISAPLTGIVTRIDPIEGEAVEPGQPLFEMRLTHEELVEAQANFLRTATDLDVIRREIARLEDVAAKGAIAGKTLLERTYERDRLTGALQAQREALLLHGLTPEQVDGIEKNRQLLGTITVTVPQSTDKDLTAAATWQVQKVLVAQGQHVNAGEALAVLANHAELYIEGNAFEQDARGLSEAAERGWELTVVFENRDERATVSGLKLFYVASEVDPETRALRFYVRLPNELVRDTETAEGHRFVGWRYRPGQRAKLLIPVEEWDNRIVLPIDAVAQEGAESYVFLQNGDHFDRVPVHVEYRDQFEAVVANDGAIYPGDTIAMNAAQRLQLALKSRSSPVDPHAGHDH